MNFNEINKRIKGLNNYMLANSNKELLLLRTSSVYTYNKAVALVNKNCRDKTWYAIDDKNCFKTWSEVEAFIDGICKGKNTNFYENTKER